MYSNANVNFLVASATYANRHALTATRAERLSNKRRALRDAAEARRIANRQAGIETSLAALRASFRNG